MSPFCVSKISTGKGDGCWCRAKAAGKAGYRWRGYTHVSANGVSGFPAKATAAKGEKLLEAAAGAIAALITDPETWAPMADIRGEGTGGVPFRK